MPIALGPLPSLCQYTPSASATKALYPAKPPYEFRALTSPQIARPSPALAYVSELRGLWIFQGFDHLLSKFFFRSSGDCRSGDGRLSREDFLQVFSRRQIGLRPCATCSTHIELLAAAVDARSVLKGRAAVRHGALIDRSRGCGEGGGADEHGEQRKTH